MKQHKPFVFRTTVIIFMVMFMLSCTSKKKPDEEIDVSTDIINNHQTNATITTFKDDVTFLNEYIELIQLSDASNQSKIAISPALQGRVMTSSALGDHGRSYGWINRALFESRDTLDHINAFGGEERFWLGPEGGQFSIFFENGDEFNLENWQTPRLIDLDHFEVKNQSKNSVMFTKEASLKNYSGFQFDMRIEREISLLANDELQKELGLESLNKKLKVVAYQTANTLTNIGKTDWKKETGLLSIWLLGMYNHSPNTTIMIPYISGNEPELGVPVNDNYFGKVPSERLVVKEDIIYFSGDGAYRSKVGLSPMRAKDIAGSYDSKNGVLTIVKYNKPENATAYVNSMWEIQEEPFAGDVINAYNDGKPSPGEKPLGPFYELETSSPALVLKSGENQTHTQLTCHIEGDITILNPIIKQLFGVTAENIKNGFN